LALQAQRWCAAFSAFAHVEDLESIEDSKIRSACEIRALHLARSLMLDRASIGDVKGLRARIESADTAAPSWPVRLDPLFRAHHRI
jgi:hypothetical protein